MAHSIYLIRTLAAACLALAGAGALALTASAQTQTGWPATPTQGPQTRGSSAGLPLSAVPQAASQTPAAFDVVEKTIPELQSALQQGLVTSRALVELYLARITAYDKRGPQINAMISLNPQALATADALDAERTSGQIRGPLHGIPIVLKDNFDTAGMPTTAGSIALATWVPADDAFQVRKLRQAGVVIIGKTNMHELASGITTISSLGGQTRNPYDLVRNPGGSSGGTGAAVAASFAAAGMGSDTCGSIRIPASHNNLVGLRGTIGLSSRDGIVPLSHTQDIGGPLARTITDLAIMLDATIGPDPADAATYPHPAGSTGSFRDSLTPDGLRGARIGLLKELFGTDDEEQEVSRIIRQAAEDMKKGGAEVIEVSLANLEDLLEGSGVINWEFKFDLIDYLAAGIDPPVSSLADILASGLHHIALDDSFRRRNAVESRDSAAYREALEKRRVVQRRILEAFDEHGLTALVYPTMRQEPALIGEPQRGSNCQLSAATGFPALSVPAGFTEEGLPVGLELLGRPGADKELLRLGFTYEQATQHRRPPSSVPPLVDGRPPAPVRFEAIAVANGPSVDDRPQLRARLVFDPLRSQLDYQVSVTGYDRDVILGALLHRQEEDGSQGPSLLRVLEPGALQGVGGWTLTRRDRADLRVGRLHITLYTRVHPLGALRAQLRLP